MNTIPELRIHPCNDAPVNGLGDFVLYWMIAYRRIHWNFSLQRAVAWAKELDKPLVVLEALRCGYRWASNRLHGFIIDGMVDNARRFAGKGVFYYPYLEPQENAGKGLLSALAAKACVVITDDFPEFFLPNMVAAAARELSVRLEKIDSNGLLPLRATDRVFQTAYSFRHFLQRDLPSHLLAFPQPDPLSDVRLPKLQSIPEKITRRWPMASSRLMKGDHSTLANLPIDHRVDRVETQGGPFAAQKVLERFLSKKIDHYHEARNEVDEDGTSGLSPYLHFGHISTHQVFHDLLTREGWSLDHLSSKATRSRLGWWGVREAVETFLDQLITWRELGYNMCARQDDYDRYESLPDWAKKTLSEHAKNPRPYIYSLEELEAARTHGPLWNAAQMELAQEGRIHNYLRMLWGKKILEWSPTPQEALEVMIELNNRYALDGRNPNSYSGIFWVLGRYDRPWGPERPIFGKIRYMSSKSTLRKVRIQQYLQKYAP